MVKKNFSVLVLMIVMVSALFLTPTGLAQEVSLVQGTALAQEPGPAQGNTEVARKRNEEAAKKLANPINDWRTVSIQFDYGSNIGPNAFCVAPFARLVRSGLVRNAQALFSAGIQFS